MRKPDASPAFATGVVAFALSAGIFFFSPTGIMIPLSIFVIICLIAPFFPQTGFFLPVISRGTSGKPAVAITFDDGPDTLTTPLLLQMLAKYGVKATFFVVGEKAQKHPHLIRDILKNGHSIGNHTFTHDVMIMLKSEKKLFREIASTQTLLKQFGILPLGFRPPVGIVNPKLGGILKKQNLFCVHYSCRGLDTGNRRIKNLSKKILRKIRKDDILLLHDVRPPHDPYGARIPVWLKEIDCILAGMPEKGLCVLPLSNIIGKPVMQLVPIAE
jgi:peptidoglycan/xylan/chitin deacetylase (PgdA/CDA1 family)